MKRILANMRPHRSALNLMLTLAFSTLVASTQAAGDSQWTPQTLTTTPPVVRPLGCRQSESQLVCRPNIDTSSLPAMAKDAQAEINPYRGNAAAAAVGQRIFNETCAFCHGANADNTGAIGADLSKIDVACNPVADKVLHERCERDVNAFFVDRVSHGKVTFGIVMMPPWGGVLDKKDIWAIKTFLDSRNSR